MEQKSVIKNDTLQKLVITNLLGRLVIIHEFILKGFLLHHTRDDIWKKQK
jgi:hypothetical protein